ncbi:hypothetical protein G6F24_012066 [Rhizopus arrhizus]|nr:hypothetical protein G6F24_012066 [Rhizopus arrhizus]
MFQPLSGPLQPGFRFLCDPIPAQPTDPLAVHLPEGSHTGLPRSLPVTRLEQPVASPFWLMPISRLGTVMLTTFISSSLVLPIPASLAPQPGTAPSICAPPHGEDAPIRGLHCWKSFTPHRYQ